MLFCKRLYVWRISEKVSKVIDTWRQDNYFKPSPFIQSPLFFWFSVKFHDFCVSVYYEYEHTYIINKVYLLLIINSKFFLQGDHFYIIKRVSICYRSVLIVYMQNNAKIIVLIYCGRKRSYTQNEVFSFNSIDTTDADSLKKLLNSNNTIPLRVRSKCRHRRRAE